MASGKLYDKGDPLNLRLSKRRVNDTIMDAVNAASSKGTLNNYVLEAIELYAKLEKIFGNENDDEKFNVKDILQDVALSEQIKKHKVFKKNRYRNEDEVINEALDLLQKNQRRGSSSKKVDYEQESIFNEKEVNTTPISSNKKPKIENKSKKQESFNKKSEILNKIDNNEVAEEIFGKSKRKKGLNAAFSSFRRK